MGDGGPACAWMGIDLDGLSNRPAGRFASLEQWAGANRHLERQLLPSRMPRMRVWLQVMKPDVLCLQETKIADEQFPYEDLRELGYEAVHRGMVAGTGWPSCRGSGSTRS